MNWTSADVNKATRPTGKRQEATIAPQATPVPVGGSASLRSEEKAKCEIPTLPPPTFGELPGPCSWLRGPQCVALAANHFGDRQRIVWTGPKDEGALRAVLEALEKYHSLKITNT